MGDTKKTVKDSGIKVGDKVFGRNTILAAIIIFSIIGLFMLRGGLAGSTLPKIAYLQSSPGTQEYNGAGLAGVKDGLSGMFVSRKNANIHWFIVDHHGKISGDWEVFAIDAKNDKLVWRGKFAKSAISGWNDVEDLSGYQKNGEWYLTIWENGKDNVYEFKEPTVNVGQSRKDVNPIPLTKKVHVSGLDGNVEGMAYSTPENAMYFLGPRGYSADFHDNGKNLRKVTNWSNRGNNDNVSSTKVGTLVARPINADVPNAVGALDISPDGNVMAVVGVASGDGKKNTYAMPFVKKKTESWGDSLSRKSQLTKAESFVFKTTNENGAFAPDMKKIYAGGEGSQRSSYGKIYSVRIDYTPSVDSGSTPDPDPDPDPSALGWELPTIPKVGPRTTSCSGVSIRPGDSWQSKVNNNPEGTTFCVKAGTHRRATVNVKKGNTFIGEVGAIMDGENAVRHAFTSSNAGENNVTIKNLEIKRYTPPNADPWNPKHVIDPKFRQNWVIENNEIHHSSGVGAHVYANSVVRGNYFHHMERYGLQGGGGAGILVENNEFAYNGQRKESNKLGYDFGDGRVTSVHNGGQGGMKFAFTDGLVFRGNYVHNNTGKGYWTDIDNDNVLVEGNIVRENSRSGIEHEIGCSIVIRNNLVERNGFGNTGLTGGWLGDSAITIAMSNTADVYENLVLDNFRGIGGTEYFHQEMADGKVKVNRCNPILKDMHVHDNVIRHKDYAPAGISPRHPTYGNAAYGSARNNVFEDNTYVLSGNSKFRWDKSWFSWDQWKAEFPTETQANEIPDGDPKPDPDPDPDPTGTSTRIEAEDYREGGEGVGYHDTTPENKGNGTCRNDAVDMGTTSYGCAITWISDGEWLKYDVNISKAGNYTVKSRVANGGSFTNFDLKIGGTHVANVPVSSTGGWGDYKTVTKTDVSLPAGQHTLRISSTTGGYNIDWLEFIGDGTVTVASQAEDIESRVEAEDYRGGGEGVGYHDTTPENKGNGTCRNDAVDMGSLSGGCAITWISDGEWLKYKVKVSRAGTYTVRAHVANGSVTTSFDLKIDNGQIANVSVPSTSAWWKYQTISKSGVSLPSGDHVLTFTTATGSFNIDWLEFVGPGTVTVTSP